MEDFSKRIVNRKGVALLYVVMAVLAIAAICLSVALLSTNLYARTAAVSAQQQAMVMSKSVAQAFAKEYVGSNTRKFLEYLLKGFCPDCHIRYTYNPTKDIYSCTSCGKAKQDSSTSNERITVRCEVVVDDNSLQFAYNKEYLSAAIFADISMSFYLSDDRQYLYSDVTTSYNGATATATLVMSYVDDVSFDDTMYDLFTYYNIYLTEAGGSSFTFTGKSDSGVYPTVFLYSDTTDQEENNAQVYYVEKDINNAMTMSGDFVLTSTGTPHNVMGNITAYGDLTLRDNITLPADASDDYCNLYVSGDLTLGSPGYAGPVTINRNVYCEQSVTVYQNVVFGAGCNIYAEGNVVLKNAAVNDVYCTNGRITAEHSTLGRISTMGATTLSDNTVCNGDIFCGQLTIRDSSAVGNIHVQSISLEQVGTEIVSGDMSITMTSAATGDMAVGDTEDFGSIYVDGDLTICRQVETYDVNIYGTVEVKGALKDPGFNGGTYPYVSHLYGDLRVDGGVNIKTGIVAFTVNYLVGLSVHHAASGGGNVWLNWSIPVFTVGSDSTFFSANNLSAANVSLGAWQLPSNKATYIEETLFVSDSTTYRNSLAGNFAFSSSLEDSAFFGDDFEKNANAIMSSYNSNFVCLRNAVINNIRVGSTTSYFSMAVWGGTITGNVLAHHIRMAYVKMPTATQTLYAKITNGVAGNLSLRSVYTDMTTKYTTSYAYECTCAAQTYVSGDMAVRYGVVIPVDASLSCAGSAYLYGDIAAQTIVGTAGGVATAFVGPYANLRNNDDEKALYVNGDLRSMAQGGVESERTKTTYVGRDAYINGKLATVHIKSADNIKERTADCSPKFEEDGTADYYTADACHVVIIREGNLDHAYNQMYGDYNVTILFAGPSRKIDFSIINKTNADSVWYIQTSCTIGGSLATVGNIVLASGINVVIQGNLRARMIHTVDAADSYIGYPPSLTSISMTDSHNETSASIDNLSVTGDMEIDTLNRKTIFNNCSITGTLYTTNCHNKSLVTLNYCTIGYGVRIVGTSGCGDLTLNNTTVGFGITERDVDLIKYGVVHCRVLTMDASQIRGTVYSTATSSNGTITLKNSSEIYYSLYAANAPLKLESKSVVASASSLAVKEVLRVVSAFTINGAADATSVGNAVNGGAEVIINKSDSTSTVRSDFYAGQLALLVTKSKVRVRSSEAPTIKYSYYKNHILNTSGTAYSGTLNMTQVDKSVKEINDLRTINFPAPTSVQNMVPLSPVKSGSVEGLLSWDTVVKPTFTLGLGPDAADASAVTYVDLSHNPNLMLDNEYIWNPQTIALMWVFPFYEDVIKAATAKGEQVWVNNTSTGDLTMSVAYTSLGTLESISAIGTRLQNKFEVDFIGQFNKEFDESDAKWWDVFGLFGQSSVVAFTGAMYRATKSFFNNLYSTLTSTSAVSDWAGINQGDNGYQMGVDAQGRYIQSSAGITNVLNAAGGKDMLVLSTQSLTTTGNMYDSLVKWKWLKKLLELLDKDSTLIQYLKSIGWGGWKFEYYPSGIFFFESGCVPAEVFNSYTDYYHTAYSTPTYANYRSSGGSNARDAMGRWYWGGGGSISGAVSDCTWTFYTCTDPTNPYTSDPKDLHIVIPKHTYFAWKADSQNNVQIIGNGRVFLYLQEDTDILIAGKDMPGSDVQNVFGGLRRVAVDTEGKTAYRYDSSGERVGVYLDPEIGTNYALQPRMFIVGTGPNIHLEIRDFTVAAYVYMPNGRSYIGDDESAYSSGGIGGVEYHKENILYLTSTSEAAKDINIYGMYVADQLSTTPPDGGDFASISDSKIKYFETEVDLSNTVMYRGSSIVTKARTNGMYRLSEFWTFPPDLNVADMHFYYYGLQVD